MGRFGEALGCVGILCSPLASGRTDSGVHALFQPIAFDIPTFWEKSLEKLRISLNHKLAPYIKIKKILAVKDDFHPRFHAKKRVYRYAVKVGEHEPFLSDYVTFVRTLETAKIEKAIKLFEGKHDFGFFKKTGSEEKSSVRIIHKASFYRHKGIYLFRFEANSFLRGQIRLMMGALLDISDGKITAQELKEQIDGIKRHTVRIAPPNGLYLSKVFY